jgi:hypothetical protein
MRMVVNFTHPLGKKFPREYFRCYRRKTGERKEKAKPQPLSWGFLVSYGGLRGWACQHKDLLDSRSLVYYSLTLTIYDSLPVYVRGDVRPRASYPQGEVGNSLRQRKGFGRDAGLRHGAQGSTGQKKTLRTTKLPWSSEHSEESYRLTSGLGNNPALTLASMLTFGHR